MSRWINGWMDVWMDNFTNALNALLLLSLCATRAHKKSCHKCVWRRAQPEDLKAVALFSSRAKTKGHHYQHTLLLSCCLLSVLLLPLLERLYCFSKRIGSVVCC